MKRASPDRRDGEPTDRK